MIHARCPRCASFGEDTREDNLAIYEDGHEFCFSCRYYKPPSTMSLLRSSLYSFPNASLQSLSLKEPPDLSQDRFTLDLPNLPRLWLDHYGITRDEQLKHNITFDLDRNLLICPVYDGDRLVSMSGRYFGRDQSHPRYITHHYRKDFYKLFTASTPTPIFVLVEDFISAIKVGRQFNCIPLLGSYIPLKLVLSLIFQQPTLRIWLDRDKAQEAIKFSAMARQYIPNCATIITEEDPKYYNDNQIKDIIKLS